jgi:hypothetical protein
MSTDYLYRHWQKLGGFKDADGRVKFAGSDLRKHIERARRRWGVTNLWVPLRNIPVASLPQKT